MLRKAILKFEYQILQTWLITAKTPPRVNFMKTNLLIHTCGIFTHLWNPVVRLFTLLISFILKDQVSVIWNQSLLSHYPLWHAYLNIWWRLKISHIIIVFTCFVKRHRSKEKKLPQLFYCFHSELICFIACFITISFWWWKNWWSAIWKTSIWAIISTELGTIIMYSYNSSSKPLSIFTIYAKPVLGL